MAGSAAQTMQQLIKLGAKKTPIMLTHNKHIPLLVNVLKDVLKDSNLDGQIKAIFPGTKQTVRKTKQIFDVEVAGAAAKGGGHRLVARFKTHRQEAFVLTTYSAEELQFCLDIAMGKYNYTKRPAHLDHLTSRRPAKEVYFHPEQLLFANQGYNE